MPAEWASYATRMDSLLQQASMIAPDLPPQTRWVRLRELTCQHHFGSEEFIEAGRRASVFPSHQLRLQAADLAQLRDEYWELGHREVVDPDGTIRPLDQMSQPELYQKLILLYE